MYTYDKVLYIVHISLLRNDIPENIDKITVICGYGVLGNNIFLNITLILLRSLKLHTIMHG